MPDSHHVALCGATHPHSRSHLRTLHLSDSIETISIYDPDEEALRTIREEIGDKVQAVHSELDHLLSESPFAAVADLPTDKNEELCEGLIRNGVHILSEKPIARTSGRLDAILNQADSKGIRVGVMYFNRYHPCTQHAKRCVEEGLLGRTTSAEARVITSQVRFRNPEHWLFDSGRSGGGILSWLGCHHLDLLIQVAGGNGFGAARYPADGTGEAVYYQGNQNDDEQNGNKRDGQIEQAGAAHGAAEQCRPGEHGHHADGQ